MEAYEAKRNKQTSRLRSVMDFGIGTLVILVGVFLFVRDNFTLAFNEKFPPDEKDKYIGVIFFLYGAWRVYRGIKKIQ